MLTRRPVAIAAVSGVASLIAAVILVDISADWSRPSPIAGDPTLYGDIASSILAGRLPYLDVTVEHLPILLVPILFVGLLAGATSISYAALWPLVTIGAIVGTVAMAGRIELGRRYQRRFALAVLPMLPLMIFRLEIYVVFTAVAAIAAFGTARYRTGSMWTLIGTLAKGWPITLVGVPFRRGQRVLALGTAILGTAFLLSVAMMPGFQQGRSFEGIHSETIVGNLILVLRHVTGADLGLIRTAGAIYVSAPVSAVVLNALIAVPVLAMALRLLFRSNDTTRLVLISGLATAGTILVSPLFSAQFTFWLVPFVALANSRVRSTYLATAALSTMVAAFWNPLQAWWALEVLLRNVTFVALIVLWMFDLHSAQDTPDAVSGPSENVS